MDDGRRLCDASLGCGLAFSLGGSNARVRDLARRILAEQRKDAEDMRRICDEEEEPGRLFWGSPCDPVGRDGS